jgi:hypothetical protein
MKTCINCRYYKAEDDGVVGRCHAAPPRMVSVVFKSENTWPVAGRESVRPIVRADDLACATHEAAWLPEANI